MRNFQLLILTVITIYSCSGNRNEITMNNYLSFFEKNQYDSAKTFLDQNFKISFDGGGVVEGDYILRESFSNNNMLDTKYSNIDLKRIDSDRISISYELRNWQIECFGINEMRYEDIYTLNHNKIIHLNRTSSSELNYDSIYKVNHALFYNWLESKELRNEVLINGSIEVDNYFKYLSSFCKEREEGVVENISITL